MKQQGSVLKTLGIMVSFIVLIILCMGVTAHAAVITESEPNDSTLTANEIPFSHLGQLVKGTINTFPQNDDYFKFAPRRNLSVSFDLSVYINGSGDATKVGAVITEDNGNVISRVNVSYDYFNKKYTLKKIFNLIANRTYYINISNNDFVTNFNYDFSINEVGSELEPNDTFNLALNNGNSLCNAVSGKLENVNDFDYYTFVPSNKGGYVFEICPYSNASADLKSYLYNKDYQIIDGGDGAEELIGDNLEAGQTYYLKICTRLTSMSFAQNYSINVRLTRPLYDEIETNNSFSFATILSNDYFKVYNACLSSTSDIDFYKFIPASSGVYTIESKGTLNTYCNLYNSVPQNIGYNDDDGDGSNFKINNYYFTSGQTYYIEVGGSTTGDYKLKITPPESIGSDAEGNTFESAKQITGYIYSGAINSSSDIDYLTFTTSTSGMYLIESTNYIDLDGVLYGKDKLPVMYDIDDNDDIENTRIILNCPANEKYYLKVSSLNGAAGSYKIYVTPGKILEVPKYNQYPCNSLCWANTASMIISYYNHDNINRSLEIAKSREKNSSPDYYLPYVFNKTGSPDDVSFAILSYAAKKTDTISGFTFDKLKTSIDSNKPIALMILWKRMYGGHFHTIVGYKIQSGVNYVIYNDSLDGKEHTMPFDLYMSNDEWLFYNAKAEI